MPTRKSAAPSRSASVQVVIVGSIGLDTIATPFARRAGVLGGSATYACAAASFFTRVGMVGVVGTDFGRKHLALYRRFGFEECGRRKEHILVDGTYYDEVLMELML